MLTRSPSFSSHVQESDTIENLAEDFIDQDQKLHELQTELDGLQRLVCYLLEKNERLRTQVQALAEPL